MLEKKDLQAIRSIMKEELANSENLILQEVDRVQENLEKQIERVEKNLDDLKQYYENKNRVLIIRFTAEKHPPFVRS